MANLKNRLIIPAFALGMAGLVVGSSVATPLMASAATRSDVFDYSTVITEQNMSYIVVDPDVTLSAESLAVIADINARLAEIEGQLDADAAVLEANIKAVIAKLDQAIEQLKDLAKDAKTQAEAALQQALVEIRAVLVDYVESAVYAREYNPGVKAQAYSDALAKAQQDQSDWQAAVDAYEASGGVVDKIAAAVTSFNTILDGNSTVRGLFSALGLPDPVTNEWMIANITSVASTINKVNCSSGLVALLGATAACNSVKAEVATISSNLSDYQLYKDLLANPPADPVAYATEEAEKADTAEKGRAETVAKAEALAAGLLFDQAVVGIGDLIEQGKTEAQEFVSELAAKITAKLETVKAKVEVHVADAKAQAAAYYQALLDQKSGLTLVSTTTVGNNSGSNSRELTWRDIVNRDFDIADYRVAVDTSEFDKCSSTEVTAYHKLTLESAWPDEIKIDFSRSYTLPTFTIDPIAVNLKDIVIKVPGHGVKTIPASQLNSGINQFLDQHVNNKLAKLVDEVSGSELSINVHKSVSVPSLSGLLDEATDELVYDLYSPSCDLVIDGPIDEDPVKKDDGFSYPNTGYGPSAQVSEDGGATATPLVMALIAAGALGTGGALLIARKRRSNK